MESKRVKNKNTSLVGIVFSAVHLMGSRGHSTCQNLPLNVTCRLEITTRTTHLDEKTYLYMSFDLRTRLPAYIKPHNIHDLLSECVSWACLECVMDGCVHWADTECQMWMGSGSRKHDVLHLWICCVAWGKAFTSKHSGDIYVYNIYILQSKHPRVIWLFSVSVSGKYPYMHLYPIFFINYLQLLPVQYNPQNNSTQLQLHYSSL